MCYGAEAAWVPAVVAAVAGGTGTALAAKASNKQQEAQAEAQSKEMFRQAELQRQSDNKVREGIEQFTPEKQDAQLQQAVADRTENLQAATPAADYQPVTASAPVEVSSDLSRRLGDVSAGANDEAVRRARLGAYGDVSQQQGFDMNRMREALRRYRMQSEGASRVLPYQLQEASRKGGNLKIGSDIANTIGQAASYYAVGAKKPSTSIGYGTIDPTTAGGAYPY